MEGALLCAIALTRFWLIRQPNDSFFTSPVQRTCARADCHALHAKAMMSDCAHNLY